MYTRQHFRCFRDYRSPDHRFPDYRSLEDIKSFEGLQEHMVPLLVWFIYL